jgi:translation initiation factor 1
MYITNITLLHEIEDELRCEQKKVEISVQQRNTRKYVTIINSSNLRDVDNLAHQLRKLLNCRASVIGDHIELSGDQRENVRQFLINKGIAKKETIKVHGF